MSQPDPLSSRAAAAISAEEAAVLLGDDALRAEAARRGVDAAGIVANLRLDGDERLRRADARSTHATFFRCLDEVGRRGVRCVVIGGLAAAFYGATEPTDDFDICQARDRRNLATLAAWLRDLGAEFRRLPAHAPAEICAEVFATETDFVFTTPLGKVDLIGEFTGVGRYEQALAGAVRARLGRHVVRVLALPLLIDAKRSTGREKDLRVHHELAIVAAARRRLDALASTQQAG